MCKIAIYFTNWIVGAEPFQGVKSLREEILHGSMVSVSLLPDTFLPKGTLFLCVCTWVTNVITNKEESRRLNLNLRGAFFSVILSRVWNSKLLYGLNLILFLPNLKGEWVQIGQKRKFPPRHIDLMDHETTTYHVLMYVGIFLEK